MCLTIFQKPVTAQIYHQICCQLSRNTNVIAPGLYKVHTKPNQTRTPQLHQDIRKPNKRVSFSTGVIPNTSVSRPQLKSNHLEDRVMSNNSQGKKQEVEDHRRKFKFSNNKTSVTACNDSLNAKTSNVNFVCVTCGKNSSMVNDFKLHQFLERWRSGSRNITIKRFSWHKFFVFHFSAILNNFPVPIFLMAKATSSQAWLWHRRLSYLNFDTINLLSKNIIVNGLAQS
ncbi:hypothetical protein Tco_0413078 [Tanacetum coccineum]